VSAAAHKAEVASDATASPPPATATARSPRDPWPDRAASLATDAVNRANEAADINWPAALSLAERELSVKYRRISAGSEPGRGYGESARAIAPATPAMKLAPVKGPLNAPRSRNWVSVFPLASVRMTPRLLNMMFLLLERFARPLIG